MFLKSFDTSGNIKDTEYVANLFHESVEQVGVENVVQIITDNASNFKAVRLSIKAKYPHIFQTPCVVHTLNLALKAICKLAQNYSHYDQCKWISTLMSDIQNIRNFVMNHTKALTIFKKYSKLNLLKVGETRFASHVIMAERFLKVKSELEIMVLDLDQKSFQKTHLESKADSTKEYVIFDNWWDKLEYFLNFIAPSMA